MDSFGRALWLLTGEWIVNRQERRPSHNSQTLWCFHREKCLFLFELFCRRLKVKMDMLAGRICRPSPHAGGNTVQRTGSTVFTDQLGQDYRCLDAGKCANVGPQCFNVTALLGLKEKA